MIIYIPKVINIPKTINTEDVEYKNGATRETTELIIKKLSNNLGFREWNILENLTAVEQNKEVPSGYVIYEFFDNFGDGFEAGKTPNGYSITN